MGLTKLENKRSDKPKRNIERCDFNKQLSTTTPKKSNLLIKSTELMSINTTEWCSVNKTNTKTIRKATEWRHVSEIL